MSDLYVEEGEGANGFIFHQYSSRLDSILAINLIDLQ